MRHFFIYKILVVTPLLLIPLFTFEAKAMTYYLQQDLGVRGNMHYCKYSDGKVYTFNATELCKLSIEVGGVQTRGSTVGFLAGEYQDGMTKVCVYDVLGNKRALRLNSTQLCPLNTNF